MSGTEPDWDLGVYATGRQSQTLRGDITYAVRPEVCAIWSAFSLKGHPPIEATIRFSTINIRGLAARRRRYQLGRLFANNELEIIAVEETNVESQEQTDHMVQPFRALSNVCVPQAVGTWDVALCLFADLYALSRRLWTRASFAASCSAIFLLQMLNGV